MGWYQFDDDSAFSVRVVGISGHGRGESCRPAGLAMSDKVEGILSAVCRSAKDVPGCRTGAFMFDFFSGGAVAGRGDVTLLGVVHHYAVCVEAPSQRADRALHAFGPGARQAHEADTEFGLIINFVKDANPKNRARASMARYCITCIAGQATAR